MVAGSEVRASSARSSVKSTGAAGPSGRRPNSVNSRASCSRRPDSATRTSMASRCSAPPDRTSSATASRIGVSGLRISCATRRAVSLKARSRSASISCARARSRAAAMSRSAVRSAANSGAPRRGRSGGSGSIRRIFPVHPISSSIGRLSWRERWPPKRIEAYTNAPRQPGESPVPARRSSSG